MSLTKQQAESVFQSYADGVWKAVVDFGFERYKKMPFRTAHRRATAASTVHDLMVLGAQQVFADNPKVRFIELRGTDITLMEVEEKVLVWFKKLDNLRMPKGNRTTHSRNLLRGLCDDLPGINPAATVVVVGYIANREHTRVMRVSVMRPSGGIRPEWFFDLDKPADNIQVMPSDGDGGGVAGGGHATKIKIISGEQQAGLIG